eukprot:gene23658-25165_t
MAERKFDRMSPEAFLAWEAEQDLRYELVDGQPMLMTGGTRAHDGVRLNLAAEFRRQLRGKPCRAHLDVKVACPTGNIRYPDALIDCGVYQPGDLVAPRPTVVVEVLSPSTKATDFLAKVRDYESVLSISTYAIFWQDEARAGVSDSIVFADVGVGLDMADVYEDVLVASAPVAG